MAAETRRVDLGFSGGQVLPLRLSEDTYTALRGALDQASGDGSAWHEVQAPDATVAIDLRQVVYVRLDTEQHKVGF